jgi:hypothetical protein
MLQAEVSRPFPLRSVFGSAKAVTLWARRGPSSTAFALRIDRKDDPGRDGLIYLSLGR